jgi:hypothetical protein
MRLRPEFEKECFEAVINDLKRQCVCGVDSHFSDSLLEADVWIDVYDKSHDELYAVNYSWDWVNDKGEPIEDGGPVSVVAYPTEEFEKDGKTLIREKSAADCVVLL